MKKVIVIDDDDNVRSFMANMLRTVECELYMAENGRIGVDLIENEGIDLAIVDILMPEMDGLEVITELRKGSSDVKIFAMSGGGSFEFVDMLDLAKTMGAAKVFPKPFDCRKVLDEINLALQ